MKKIAIFCGGPSSEHEVSLSSAKSILQNLDKKKYSPYIFYIQKNSKSSFYKARQTINPPKNTAFKDFEMVLKESLNEFDVALLSALHGEFGEDGAIQLILENLGVKYTGSNSKASMLCMDKYASMEKVKSIKDVYIPKTIYLTSKKLTQKSPMKFPFIVKPNALGSSVLVFIINNQKEYEISEVLVQELIQGIEIQCASLETNKGKFLDIPPIEIRPNSNFFDYDSKYKVGGAEEITPPISISKKESKRISKLTNTIHKSLGCKTYSRTDFMYKDGKVYFLEINTQPGMTATSLLPQEAKAAGISFTKLIDFMIEESN